MAQQAGGVGAAETRDAVGRGSGAHDFPDHAVALVKLPAGIDGAIAYTVEGRPTYRALLMPDPMEDGITSGLPMTALAATNAIPAVVAARSGHLSPVDLPFYATRRAAS